MIKSARIKFDKLLGETPRAFLIRIANENHWIPKSQCKGFTTNKKLGGNVILPSFIINSIFNTDINKEELYHVFITPICVIEHHIPEKKKATKIDPDDSLIR